MGNRIPGVIGLGPPQTGDVQPGGGMADPGPGGMDPSIPLTDRIILKVEDDWHPPAPDTSPEVEVDGQTLADVGDALKSLDEWGRGGGALRAEPTPVGNSTNLTAKLHGHLVLRLAKWNDYTSASAAAKREWDRMMVKLKAHEQRHMEIAIEEFDKASAALVGKDISQIPSAVSAANAAAKKRQEQLDHDTDHGSKKGVAYGDVYLDTSIQ